MIGCGTHTSLPADFRHCPRCLVFAAYYASKYMGLIKLQVGGGSPDSWDNELSELRLCLQCLLTAYHMLRRLVLQQLTSPTQTTHATQCMGEHGCITFTQKHPTSPHYLSSNITWFADTATILQHAPTPHAWTHLTLTAGCEGAGHRQHHGQPHFAGRRQQQQPSAAGSGHDRCIHAAEGPRGCAEWTDCGACERAAGGRQADRAPQ